MNNVEAMITSAERNDGKMNGVASEHLRYLATTY
jgi:hypothetical protein